MNRPRRALTRARAINPILVGVEPKGLVGILRQLFTTLRIYFGLEMRFHSPSSSGISRSSIVDWLPLLFRRL